MVLDPTRRVLPLASHARGKRSPLTCSLKCGDQCAGEMCNTSANEYFPEVVAREVSRRTILGTAGVGALALVLSPSHATSAAAPPSRSMTAASDRLRFVPIAPVPNTVDAVTVPAGYTWSPIIRWGDPLLSDAPEWDPENQSAAAQSRQFGYNCDYLDILPDRGQRGRTAVAVVNHEYTNENIMFPPTSDADRLEEYKRIAMAAHGLSVVELTRQAPGRPWSYVRGARRNRRVTTETPFVMTGPAAGHPLLRTVEDPLGRQVRGTLNNCAGGTTPWGTVLSGEENFNQYFVATATPENRRYGIPSAEGGRRWWTVDPRFDARTAGYENEVNRHGWIVEIDPQDPTSTPQKHTMLGRFKHEGATIAVAGDGRVVAYSGDDERFEYVYKFISKKRMRKDATSAARTHNLTLLHDGDLYVAKFTGNSPASEIDGNGTLPDDGAFDGRGQWLPLVIDGRSRVPGMSVAEVLVYTRIAADRAGATKMDRPEDVEPNPATGAVYIALTNNTARSEADEPNPRITNRYGHVLELVEDGDDAAALTFGWNLLIVCGDPEDPMVRTYFGGYTGPVSPISCPDNVAFDSRGNLWISTDGQPGTIGLDDALFRVPVTGPERGKVEQFLAVPVDAETCGPVIHDQDGLVFVAVQHPGEDGSWDDQRSYFPDYVAPGTQTDGQWGGPRPSVIQIHQD